MHLTFQDLASIEVGKFKHKPTTLTEGQVEATHTLWSSPDDKTKIGIWECTPGEFTADRSEAGEYCHILSGSATVATADGTTTRKVSAGDLLVLPRGWVGSWIIHAQLKKLFLIS